MNTKHVCIRIAAITGIAALGWIGAAQAEAPQAVLMCVQVSDRFVVFIQARGGELRVATNVEGIKDAEAVQAASAMGVQKFPEFWLPIPNDQLPERVTSVKAALRVTQAEIGAGADVQTVPCLSGSLTMYGTNEQKAHWQHLQQFSALGGGEANKVKKVKLAVMDAVRAAEQNTAWMRIRVSDSATVYVQALGGELRAAMSVEGLKDVAPIKGQSGRSRVVGHVGDEWDFGKFALPVPKDQLPEGVTAIVAALRLAQVSLRAGTGVQTRPYLYGSQATHKLDDRKAHWQYEHQIGALGGVAVDQSQVIKMAEPAILGFSLDVRPAKGELAVALRLVADGAEATMNKDGQPPPVQFRLLDSDGKQVTAKTGPLYSFGFG